MLVRLEELFVFFSLFLLHENNKAKSKINNKTTKTRLKVHNFIAKSVDKMDEVRSYLVSVYLVSTGHFKELKLLLNSLPLDLPRVFSIILALAPDLVDPKALAFLLELEQNQSKISSKPEIINHVISKYQELQSLTDLDPSVLTQRLNPLKSFIDEQALKYGLDQNNARFSDLVRARTRKTVELTGDLHFNDALFELLDDNVWYNKNILPLEYLHLITAGDLALVSWESQSDVEKIQLVYSALALKNIKTIQAPLKEFLKLTDNESILKFLEQGEYINGNGTDLDLFKNFILEVHQRLQPDEYEIFLDAVVNVYYNYSKLDEYSLSSITQTLKSLKPSPKLTHLLDLSEAASVINYDKSLKELDSNLRTSESQHEFFSKILSQISTSTTPSQITQFNNVVSKLFTKISTSDSTALLTQRLLNLKLFSLLRYNVDESLITQNFWKLFKSATNGSKSRGDLQNASKLLQLTETPSQNIKNLSKLIDAIDQLSSYSIYLEKGKPFKPSDLLSLEDGLEGLLRRVLELNEDAYKEFNELYAIFTDLSTGLNIAPVELHTIKLSSIESALTHDDFWNAYELSQEVFGEHTADGLLENSWFVFFQVSKYISSKWLETETPSGVIEAQMKLISKTLKITPVDSVQIIIQQWNSLELELSLRKELNQPTEQNKRNDSGKEYRSLDQRLARALSSTATNFLNEESSDTLGGKLVSGLANWATGSKH